MQLRCVVIKTYRSAVPTPDLGLNSLSRARFNGFSDLTQLLFVYFLSHGETLPSDMDLRQESNVS